jgi:hypothetical protein
VNASPVISFRFGLGGSHHFPYRFQAQRLLFQQLRLRAWHEQNERSQNKAETNSVSHGVPRFNGQPHS